MSSSTTSGCSACGELERLHAVVGDRRPRGRRAAAAWRGSRRRRRCRRRPGCACDATSRRRRGRRSPLPRARSRPVERAAGGRRTRCPSRARRSRRARCRRAARRASSPARGRCRARPARGRASARPARRARRPPTASRARCRCRDPDRDHDFVAVARERSRSIVPFSFWYLAALFRRFATTWVRRDGSPCTRMRTLGQRHAQLVPLARR